MAAGVSWWRSVDKRRVRDKPVSAGPDAGRGVALGVVFHRSSHVTPQLRQIGRQLEHTVDGADEHLARLLVDGQVGERGVERSVHRPAGGRSGGGGSRRGREDGGGEEEEREEREERRGRGDHRGQREEEQETRREG